MKTSVRLATESDILECLMIAKQFQKGCGEFFKWDQAYTVEVLKHAIKEDHLVFLVLVNEDEKVVVGGLVGSLVQFPFSHKTFTTEVAFFTDKNYNVGVSALKLLREFEGWSRYVGADFCTLGHIEGYADMSKVYEKLGYEKTEVVYTRKL